MDDPGRLAPRTAAHPVAGRARTGRYRPARPGLCTGLALTAALAACGGSGGGAGDDGAASARPPLDADPAPDTVPSSGTELPSDTDPSAGIDPPADADACAVAKQNEWVYDSMRDYYLFYDQVPTLDPSGYASPEALLEELRFAERDPFSFVTDATESDLEFEEGREFGLGFRFGYYEDGERPPRIIQLQPDSPFGRAGIERGDIIVSIDGVPALEMLLDDRYEDYYFDRVLGSRETPGSAVWTFRDRDTDELLTRTIVATEYSIETLRHVRRYTNPAYDGQIGYVALERFLETSEAEIDAVFSRLRDAAVTDLVLDLRYNGGGRVYVAQKLASLVAGPANAGRSLQEYRYNDKYAEENYTLPVLADVAGLDLRRLVVLVDDDTASASELIVSGLDALMDVTVVGSWPTVGKPYIQSGRDRCDRRLNAIEAEGFNEAGESVFGGIVPDCYAADDWTRQLGSNADTNEIEGMLLAGLDLVVLDRCEPFESVAATRSRAPERPGRQGFYPRGGASLGN